MAAQQLHSYQDCLQRPLDVVKEMQEEGANSPQELHRKVEGYFRTMAVSPAAANIPYLTAETVEQFSDGRLIRFRAMVQDMLDPEYFLAAYSRADGSAGLTLYSDVPPPDLDQAARTSIWERRPLYCTAVPGESAWAIARWQGHPVEASPAPGTAERTKRARELATGATRTAGTDSNMQDAPADRDQGGSEAPAKQARPAGDQPATVATGQQQSQEAEQPRYMPGDCLVYVYGDGEHIKLHDVVEVLGVVSLLPDLAAGPPGSEGGSGGAMEVDGGWEAGMTAQAAAQHPPTSCVPRIHALCITKQQQRQPLPSGPHKPVHLQAEPAQRRARLQELRGQVLQLLASALGGDALAAQYVLLGCMGRVFSRQDDQPGGLVSINLTGCPAAGAGSGKTGSLLGEGLHAVLSALLPACVLLPISLPALNSSQRWAPKKSHECGRLLAGRLQLAAGTQVVLDECGMAAGELGPEGVANLRAAAALLQRQQLPVDFEFYQSSFPLDCPALVLSTGRSLLRDCLDVAVPLSTPSPASGAGFRPKEQADAALSAASCHMEALREYMGLARSTETQLPAALAQQLSAEYRAMHAADAQFDTEQFSNCITMAKLLAMSLGQETFDMDTWRQLMALEAQRKQRLAAAGQA